MKVQINSKQLRPLIKENYSKVYDNLKRALSPDDCIFAEWAAGFGGEFQWTLPKEYEWHKITEANSVDRVEVTAEFERAKAEGMKVLGNNERLINAVYSWPADDFIYYTVDADGHYRVMITAWGYAYPTAVQVRVIGAYDAKDVNVTLRFMSDYNPIAGVPFEIIGEFGGNTVRIPHIADANGEYYLGKHPAGTQFNINIYVPSVDRTFKIIVESTREIYPVDVTPEKVEPEPEPEPALQTINVQFIANGAPTPGIEFEVVNNATQESRTFIADAEGKYYIGNFAEGTPLTVNVPLVGGNFDFFVEPDKNDYIFDLTTEPEGEDVVVRFIADGHPIAAVEFDCIHGADRTRLVANDMGECQIGFMPHGESFSIDVPSVGRTFDFTVEPGVSLFVVDITVEPGKLLFRFVDKNGKPIADREVMITQGETVIVEGVDTQGEIHLSDRDIHREDNVTVSLSTKPNIQPVNFRIDRDEDEYEIMIEEAADYSWLLNLLMWIGAVVGGLLVIWQAAKLNVG